MWYGRTELKGTPWRRYWEGDYVSFRTHVLTPPPPRELPFACLLRHAFLLVEANNEQGYRNRSLIERLNTCCWRNCWGEFPNLCCSGLEYLFSQSTGECLLTQWPLKGQTQSSGVSGSARPAWHRRGWGGVPEWPEAELNRVAATPAHIPSGLWESFSFYLNAILTFSWVLIDVQMQPVQANVNILT